MALAAGCIRSVDSTSRITAMGRNRREMPARIGETTVQTWISGAMAAPKACSMASPILALGKNGAAGSLFHRVGDYHAMHLLLVIGSDKQVQRIADFMRADLARTGTAIRTEMHRTMRPRTGLAGAFPDASAQDG